MTASKKTLKTKAKPNSKTLSMSEEKFGTPKGFWLYLALGLLTLLGLVVLTSRFGGLGYLATSGLFALAIEPAIVALLIVIFGPLFIYKSVKGFPVPLLAKISAYILVGIATLALVATMIWSSGQSCSTLTSSCSSNFSFVFSALYYSNLVVVVLVTVTALIGNVALLTSSFNRHQKL